VEDVKPEGDKFPGGAAQIFPPPPISNLRRAPASRARRPPAHVVFSFRVPTFSFRARTRVSRLAGKISHLLE
jgi:hypothetical protein